MDAGFDLHLLKPADIGALQQLLLSIDTDRSDRSVMQRPLADPSRS